MKSILTKTFSHQVGALINKLASCETANDMLFVDEAFKAIEDTVLSLIDNIEEERIDRYWLVNSREIAGIDLSFDQEMKDLWWHWRDDYRTAFAKKEYALMEGKK